MSITSDEPADYSLWHEPFVHVLLLIAAGFAVAAIALDPSDPEAHLRLGNLYASERKPAEAVTELAKHYARMPDPTVRTKIEQLKAKMA